MISNISKSKTLLHYKRKEVQEEMVELAQNREVAVLFGEKGFGKRPDALNHAADVLELVKNGATSFHVSEEIWQNPLQISSKLNRKDLDEIRDGWDLVLDIDCKVLDYSKIAADVLIKALKYHNIENISCKFSGNHGFHIGVPFKAFPEKVHNKETKNLFPEAPRVIAEYLQQMIQNKLGEQILEFEDINSVAKRTGKTYQEIVINNNFDPFQILDIDTILIASRHLYRMPYSFNEKSNLVSIPIDPCKVLEFNTETSKPENVEISNIKFLDSRKVINNEARQLILQAYDFTMKKENEFTPEKESKFDELKEAIPLQCFPPCINKILAGIDDGKKRTLFILINFFTSVGWSHDDIEKKLKEWNKLNKQELKEVYLLGQLRYAKQHKKKILPPNCDNKIYYKDLGMCVPDNLCSKIKNPVNYATRRAFYLNKQNLEKNEKATFQPKKNIEKEI